MSKKATHPNWTTNFLAVVRYELLWNIRKKKFVGVLILALALATLTLVLPVVLNNLNNQPMEPNPNYVINTGTGIGGLGFFFFALATVMNSISGEFESESIILLLTKPVSRTTIYLGKIFAAFLIILGAYILLIIYIAIGGFIVYGPQNHLHLLSIVLLGSILSTLVWMAIILAMGSISRSSMLSALLGTGIWFALYIVGGVFSAFSNQAWILTYAPGRGATGTLNILGPIEQNSILTGTDNIAPNLIIYILNPTANVTFYKIEISGTAQIIPVPLYTEPLSLVISRSIMVAAIYVVVFELVAWYTFKRAQVFE